MRQQDSIKLKSTKKYFKKDFCHDSVLWHVALLQSNRCHKKSKNWANNLLEFEQIC